MLKSFHHLTGKAAGLLIIDEVFESENTTEKIGCADRPHGIQAYYLRIFRRPFLADAIIRFLNP